MRKAIAKVARSDATILSLLELANADAVTKAKRITHKPFYDGELDGATRVLLVTNRPDRRTQNDAVREKVLQLECHAPQAQSDVAEQVVARLHVLFNKQTVAGQYVLYDGDLPDLPTAAGFSCAAIRFRYQSIS